MMYVVTAVRKGDSAASVVRETMSEDSATRLLAALRRHPRVGGVEPGTAALHALAPDCRCMQPYTCGDMRGRIEAIVVGRVALS